MKKILVIEDNSDIRENIEELLLLEGYVVLTAVNGEKGVALANAELPDLILCDVMMPELDGYGVLERLKKSDLTTLIPFIFLTAQSERTDISHGLSEGAIAYLVKPFTNEQLIKTIVSALR